MLSIAQLEKVRKSDPYTYESLKQIVAAINSMARQTGADPVGVFPATPNITAVNVTAANGLLNVQIVDNAFVTNPKLQGRSITYFVEVASDAGFSNVIYHVSWHGTRNGSIQVGNLTVYVRAYSQVQGSAPSSPVAATQNPIAAGGSAAPTTQAYQGSGTSSTSGQGFGPPLRSGRSGRTSDF